MNQTVSPIPAMLLALALLTGCAGTVPHAADPVPTATVPAQTRLVPFASNEGMHRLGRSQAKQDFAALANQFEAQYNGAFCGPTSAAIVLNAMAPSLASSLTAYPKDTTRLRADDTKFMPAGANPIVPRLTQDSVIERGPKTRAQVLGEPTMINGRSVQDFGYQLHQFAALLDAHGVRTTTVVADDAQSDQRIRSDLINNLARNGDYVIVNYQRAAVGQTGGGHISPLGAYDAATDTVLVMDVNPVAAGWVWMPMFTLIKGMRTFDTVSNRGYVMVHAPR